MGSNDDCITSSKGKIMNHFVQLFAAATAALALAGCLDRGDVSKLETRVQALEDQEAIRQLVVADYATALDFMDMKAYAGLFTDDGELSIGGMVMKGHEAIERMFAPPPPGSPPPPPMPVQPGVKPMPPMDGPPRPRQVPHVITNTSYTIDGDSAKGVCYWSEIMLIDGRPGIVNMGHYEDVLKKVNGKWKFAKRTIMRDVPVGTLITPPPASAP
jgi:outer membrane murein-binding lipoprotein Lpp